MSKSTFVKLNRVNSYGEKLELVVNTEEITAIKELHPTTQKLFNENGDLVSETPNPKQYLVFVKHTEPFYIEETDYQALVKELIA